MAGRTGCGNTLLLQPLRIMMLSVLRWLVIRVVMLRRGRRVVGLLLRRGWWIVLLMHRRLKIILLNWWRSVGLAINWHEILAHKHAAEQAGQRPALRSRPERYIGLKQIYFIAAFEANAAQQRKQQVTKRAVTLRAARAPEVVVAKQHKQLAGPHLRFQLPEAILCKLTRSVLRYSEDESACRRRRAACATTCAAIPASTVLCKRCLPRRRQVSPTSPLHQDRLVFQCAVDRMGHLRHLN
jgi:hypothetical protein